MDGLFQIINGVIISVGSYFSRLFKIWITGVLLILDLIGLIIYLMPHYFPNWEVPDFVFSVFIILTVVGFVWANIIMHDEQFKVIKSLTDNSISENSLSIMTRISGKSILIVEVMYLIGNEPIKVLKVALCYFDMDHQFINDKVDQLYHPTDSKFEKGYQNYFSLSPDEVFCIKVPVKDSVYEGKVTVHIDFEGVKSKRKVHQYDTVYLYPKPVKFGEFGEEIL